VRNTARGKRSSVHGSLPQATRSRWEPERGKGSLQNADRPDNDVGSTQYSDHFLDGRADRRVFGAPGDTCQPAVLAMLPENRAAQETTPREPSPIRLRHPLST